jgi:ketosteroid isomerase-like protein
MSAKKIFFIILSMCLVMGLSFLGGCAKDSAQEQETAQAIADLKKKVQSLEDLEAIKQLHIRYVNGLTYCEWEDVVDCFSEDAILEVFMGQEPTQGKAAIREVFMNQIAGSDKHVGREANLTLHPIASVDGDTAKSNWVIYFITQPDQSNEALNLVQGIYDCEYVKENGEWKMSYIKWVARLALGAVGGGPPPDATEGSPGGMGGPPGEMAGPPGGSRG